MRKPMNSFTKGAIYTVLFLLAVLIVSVLIDRRAPAPAPTVPPIPIDTVLINARQDSLHAYQASAQKDREIINALETRNRLQEQRNISDRADAAQRIAALKQIPTDSLLQLFNRATEAKARDPDERNSTRVLFNRIERAVTIFYQSDSIQTENRFLQAESSVQDSIITRFRKIDTAQQGAIKVLQNTSEQQKNAIDIQQGTIIQQDKQIRRERLKTKLISIAAVLVITAAAIF